MNHDADEPGRAGAMPPRCAVPDLLLGEEVFAMDIRTVREIIQQGR